MIKYTKPDFHIVFDSIGLTFEAWEAKGKNARLEVAIQIFSPKSLVLDDLVISGSRKGLEVLEQYSDSVCMAPLRTPHELIEILDSKAFAYKLKIGVYVGSLDEPILFPCLNIAEEYFEWKVGIK